MSSESCEVPVSNNSLSLTTIASSGSSLIDMLNQQPYQTTADDDPTLLMFRENTKPCFNQIPNSDSNVKDNDNLSTLFNTTGRERNSTGPLKQWLYEHQDHPCE
jgi:hypothetical protein